jgi:hypothetical protein
MGLATAVILTNFARLAPSAGLPRRIASGGFAALVVAAWAALLADRAAPIAIGAATVGRARPALWIAVGCEAAVVLLLLGHLLLVAPRTRLARRAPPP